MSGFQRPGRRKTREWRSIESAPRNGTPVLTYTATPEHMRERVRVACCISGFGGESEWSDPDNHRIGFLPPTHWMPLPEPPSKDAPAAPVRDESDEGYALPSGSAKESEVVDSADEARVAMLEAAHAALGNLTYMLEEMLRAQDEPEWHDELTAAVAIPAVETWRRRTRTFHTATRATADSEATTTITAGEAQPITKTACGFCRGKDNGFPCPHCAAQAKEVK